MKAMKQKWTPDIDSATIPDDIIASENAKRNARKRKVMRGGNVWAKHNPNVLKGCRCAACNLAREVAGVRRKFADRIVEKIIENSS